MKAQLYSSSGQKTSTIDLPKMFDTVIREDIVQKYLEADKLIQPYYSNPDAGKKYSASGKMRHKRHAWKSHYGRGIARLPRKIMWRRGIQFFWVGATAPGTRGGRRAHPPKGIGVEKRINKKEVKIAFNSAFAATADPKSIIKRYESIDKIDHVPFVIESLPTKTKELKQTIKQMLINHSKVAFKKKIVRPGIGKLRGRKYKSNAGVLIITASKEDAKFKGFDIKTLNSVTISDLYPLGRLTIFTKKAIEELGSVKK